VRELRNVIERAVVTAVGDHVAIDDLPDRLETGDAAVDAGRELRFRERVQLFERHLMADALRRCDGNKTAAAKALRMPLRTFMHKCRSLGLEG
jgi:two-component system C4-dicarboxylate transport response regulator DctD